MMYLLGIFITLSAGFLTVRFLSSGRLNFALQILLGLTLGFGIDGMSAFYTHILFNQFNRFLPVVLVLIATVFLAYLHQYVPAFTKNKKKKFEATQKAAIFNINGALGILVLGILAVPLVISAYHYPLGGWDAWSCWNLKAKFIFLGKENWKDVLSPGLWRSNTQYPLLWPLINVWFWDLGGHFEQAVPMFNSILIALLTAGTLMFGLMALTGSTVVSLLTGIIVTALPFGVTLYISQYSDSLVGLFLLSAFTCLLLAEKYDVPKLKILSMLFLGMMSFTKNEGLVSALIAAGLMLWHERSKKKDLKILALAFAGAMLPTVIFTLFMAPKNEAFINGLTSAQKPTTLSRLAVIFAYPWFEFISLKWNGLWVLAFAAAALAGKKLWRSTLGLIGLSLLLYLGVVLGYYAVNTFFEINWWLSTTLSRILFALVPAIGLWLAVALL